ncbi:CorA family divalent cation transporter, partial [Patescibacteria group bacterium]|nr:CorA family divalent cation transporter [Patescibacteria group bacterium]
TIEGALDEAEDKIFKGEERQMVKELSNISRNLLNIKQATNIHESILEDLKKDGSKLFDAKFGQSVNKIILEYQKMRKEIEINRESFDELRDTNNSLLSTKQNETMTVLTIMAFVTFPLSLLASIFGMNTIETPIVGHNNDFWIVVGIMFTLATLFFFFFKYKKWL